MTTRLACIACAFFATLSALVSPASAADVWRVMPAKSSIVFHGSGFDGTATVVSGVLDLTFGSERGGVIISTKSLKTGDAERDLKMHAEHLLSEKYPETAFIISRVERTPTATTIVGTLRMHGVIRDLRIPVTLPAGAATSGRLTAKIPFDIRQWSIPVPSGMLGGIDPVMKLDIDLALVRDNNATTPAPVVRRFTELTLPDQRGMKHRIDEEANGRLMMIFVIDERVLAKRCDDLISTRLGKKPLLRVIDGTQFKPDERAALAKRLDDAVTDPAVTFLLDWDGAVRKQLQLPSSSVLFVGFDPMGKVTGMTEAAATVAGFDGALQLVGITADPPFTTKELAPPRAGGKGR